jgi:hypothetical protein
MLAKRGVLRKELRSHLSFDATCYPATAVRIACRALETIKLHSNARYAPLTTSANYLVPKGWPARF